jgi:hypothetical protein
MKLITGTARQENFVCVIGFGISWLGGFQRVLVEGRGLDRKTGRPASRSALAWSFESRIMRKPIGGAWPTFHQLSLPREVCCNARFVAANGRE